MAKVGWRGLLLAHWHDCAMPESYAVTTYFMANFTFAEGFAIT
jgi:hypothetical protein